MIQENKLTIEHIAKRIPYGVVLKRYTKNPEYYILTNAGIDSTYKDKVWVEYIYKDKRTHDDKPYHGHATLGIEKVLPCLFPLSSLTKETTINGKTFIPIVELLKWVNKEWFSRNKSKRFDKITVRESEFMATSFVDMAANIHIQINKTNLDREPYYLYNQLLKWHFDIDNLIEQGLAIDASLNNPYK